MKISMHVNQFSKKNVFLRYLRERTRKFFELIERQKSFTHKYIFFLIIKEANRQNFNKGNIF